MSLVFNMTGGGKKVTDVVQVAVVAAVSTSSFVDPTAALALCSSVGFFTKTDDVHYVCQKAGNYTIYLGARSAYSSQGGSRYTCTARVYINDSYGDREIASPSDSSSFISTSYNVSLAVGDVVSLSAKNSSGNVIVNCYLAIYGPT